MPPLWALGNQQSRWGYMNADEVRGIARGFRERGIPCDVIYLDIDYMDGYRVFTWDAERFPDPAALIAELRERGLPRRHHRRPRREGRRGLRRLHRRAASRDLFCRTRDGEEYHNVVWPGLCAFPDFTNPAHARVVGRRSTPRCSTRAWPASGAT